MFQLSSSPAFSHSFFPSCKKLVLAFILCAIVNIQNINSASVAVIDTSLERDASPSPRRPHGHLAVTVDQQQFIEAVQGEYAVFKANQRGVATPIDFLTHKTAQLENSATIQGDKPTIALTIQYILRGYVFATELGLESEGLASNTIVAQAALLASAVYGVDPSHVPSFSPAMADDARYAHHLALVESANRKGISTEGTPSITDQFVMGLAAQKAGVIAALSQQRRGDSFSVGDPLALIQGTADQDDTSAKAKNMSDDDGIEEPGCCRWFWRCLWCGCCSKKEGKSSAQASQREPFPTIRASA